LLLGFVDSSNPSGPAALLCFLLLLPLLTAGVAVNARFSAVRTGSVIAFTVKYAGFGFLVETATAAAASAD
jgi:hypothetical protein